LRGISENRGGASVRGTQPRNMRSTHLINHSSQGFAALALGLALPTGHFPSDK
jgi:hypothetical protein